MSLVVENIQEFIYTMCLEQREYIISFQLLMIFKELETFVIVIYIQI